MGSSLSRSIRRKRIDDIKYEGLIHEYPMRTTNLLKDRWKLYIIPSPPLNSSETTKYELVELMGLRREILQSIEEVRRQNTHHPEKEFIELLQSKEVFIDGRVVEQINTISDELNTVVDHFKKTFNRPRPLQLFDVLGKNYNEIAESEITHSPSYPSNIATKARFFDLLFGKLYPQFKKDIHTLSSNICFNRIVCSAHFPSDIDAGRELADRLFKDFSHQYITT